MADTFPFAHARSGSSPAPAAAEGIELVGRSLVITRVQELVRRSAQLETGVLIVGERGADTASVARELHALSRAAGPWVQIECGAADAAHLDRELFGVPANRADG